MIYNSKTYRVYSRVESDIIGDRLTHRAVAVYCSWLLEGAARKLRTVLEASGATGCAFVQMALDCIEEVYDDLYKARAGNFSDIVRALSGGCEGYLFQCRSALFYLSRCRDGSLPLEGPAGDDVSSFCDASSRVAAVVSILQSNRSLPDKSSSDTRNRLCMLIDSLSDSVSAMHDSAFMYLVQGSAGFVSASEARCALLSGVEELRALAYTVHQDADMGARGCLSDSFEVLLGNVREAIRRVSDAPGVTVRASWSCALANKALDKIQGLFKDYVNGTNTCDSSLEDTEYMGATVSSAYAAARRLCYSCMAADTELSCVPAILECSSALCGLNSHVDICESIDLSDSQGVGCVLPALNKAREALDKVDPSDLPSNRDAETYARLRAMVTQASLRCIMRQCAEPGLLDPAPGAGWDDLSVEGLDLADASPDLLH